MADTREADLRRSMAIPGHESDQARQLDYVGRSGIYPASGPYPSGDAEFVGQAELGHPEERWRLRRPERSTVPWLIGRAIFGGYFLYNGINHFMNRQMLTEYARSKGVPAAEVAVPASGLMLLFGGLSLVAGRRPKVGASLITTFLLGVSPQMHAFWQETNAEQRTQELVNFTKNMALVGGTLLAAALPEPWPYRVSIGEHANVPQIV